MRQRVFTLTELLLSIGGIAAVVIGIVFVEGTKKNNEAEAAEKQAQTAKELATAALTDALLNTPTPLPPEWQEVVTYLSDAQLPNLPEGWVPIVVVKAPTVHESVFGAITRDGQFVPILSDYGRDFAPNLETRLDVGDLLVVLPRGVRGGWAISDDRFHIVKKFAFIPDTPTSRR